ncbi:hypothetical protein HYFRA_00006770 [Hymenoscyphus fraxineus]|uniref:Uncharacterized protein n=1 Tax=Hymenoscyphus fraxineus TaxID=746836 RepID=A0A9N9KPA4_9HELO|nr:hypothetical protein HYFRA_00006770 [Hymenoscyphus fraxineus]
MDFAPYQDQSPETTRALSPPPIEGRRSFSPGASRRSFSPKIRPGALSPSKPAGVNGIGGTGAGVNPWAANQHTFPNAGNTAAFGNAGNEREGTWARGVDGGWIGSGNGNGNGSLAWAGGNDLEGGRMERLGEFETSLPVRLDYEACLAYLLLPPAGGVLLLVVERKSDYVRFHAWQSSLLFSAIFVVHLIFSWSTLVSWILFAVDLLLIGYLTFRAYRDAETLDRCEVPFFGQLASSILDDE